MPFLRSLAVVGGYWRVFAGADADGENRNSLQPEPLEGRAHISLDALAIGDEQYRLKTPLSLMLEGGGGRDESPREVGGRISEVVGGGGIEEAPEAA